MKETLTLNSKEQKRVIVISKMDRAEVSVAEAALVLGVSQRQVWRMRAAYRKEGAAGLAHGNRGRRPVNALPREVGERVVALAQGPTYRGCNHQHLSELLAEREGLRVSRPTLRRLLARAGLRSPRRRRPPQHRSRRERMPQEGMLLQADGSPHAWLEDRGPRLTLVGTIDDATSTVPAAHFRRQEDAQGYLLVFRDVLSTKGVPLAVYRDRHSIFERSRREPWTLEEELAGECFPTQVQRALAELGIQSIPAYSPQAKGRIERLGQTFQDRLVIELRLAGAATLQEAEAVLQAYLPRFNAQFGVPAAQPGSAYRPLPPDLDLDTVCCFKYHRTVSPDNTVTLSPHRLQLQPTAQRASYARATVEVQERLDGSLAVYYQGQPVLTTPAPPTAPELRARKARRPGAGTPASVVAAGVGTGATRAVPESAALVPVSTPRRPAPTHPWRKGYVARALTKSLTT